MCPSKNKCLFIPKQDSSLNENHQQKGGRQPQAMDEDGESQQWSQLMGPQECQGPMHTLLKHTPYMSACARRNLVDGSGVGFGAMSKVFGKLMQVF